MVSSESMHTIRKGSVPPPPLDVSCRVRTGDLFITIFLYGSFCTHHFSLSAVILNSVISAGREERRVLPAGPPDQAAL